jgi:signal transduction histidine kinase
MRWLERFRKKFEQEEDIEELQFFDAVLLKKIIYLEWILLGIAVAGHLIVQLVAPGKYSDEAPNLVISMIFLFVVFLLSFVKPVRSTYWDRMCFLFLEIVLLTGSAATGLPRFMFPLYMISVAKGCLLLDKRGVVVIFVASFLAQVAYGSFKFYLKELEPHHINPYTISAGVQMIAGSLVGCYAALALMVLIGTLTSKLVDEQKLRLEAERLGKEVEKLATELERTRIAREIHDSLGHTLTAMNIQIEVARKFFDRDQSRATEALDVAKQLASQSLTDVRMAVQSIRNPDFRFRDAVHALTAQIQQTEALQVKVHLDAPEISSATGYQLYRIIQECLTNVMKHAQATEARVELKHDGQNLELNVSDNGIGLQKSSGGGGFGIRGMQERVESLHGTVTINSEPEKGTKLQVKIPL